MTTLGDFSINICADSGNFQGFMVTRKQSEKQGQYDQWRPLTLEEAKLVEFAVLAVIHGMFKELNK